MRAKTVSDISPAVSLTPSLVSECMASICFGRAEGKTEGKRKKGKKWMKTGRNLKRERRIKMIWRLIFFTYIITKTTLMYQILSIWLQTNEMDRTVWNANRKQFCFFFSSTTISKMPFQISYHSMFPVYVKSYLCITSWDNNHFGN